MPTIDLLAETGVHLGADDARIPAQRAVAEQRFSVQLDPTREDWQLLEQDMVAHGWDAGFSDARAARALDEHALMIGYVDDRPVSAISVLRISAAYAFVGNLFVRLPYRGLGYGAAMWQAALPRAEGRTIGIEAVPELEEGFARAGFARAHSTTTYRGRIRHRATLRDPRVREIEPRDHEAVAALDTACCPHERRASLDAWIGAGEHTLVYVQGSGQIAGFGTIRASRAGYRIGPLVATGPAAALALFDALSAPHRGEWVTIDAPGPNPYAADLARDRSLTRCGHTVRMYSNPVEAPGLERCYAIASPAHG